MLIIEIILTVLAWRNWKWLAILPVAIAFLIGYFLGASGVAVDDPNIIIIDIIAIVVLLVMAIVKPKKKLEDKDTGQVEKT